MFDKDYLYMQNPKIQPYGWFINCVEFDVFTAVVMKSFIFWDVTPCSPLNVIRRFVGTRRYIPEDINLLIISCLGLFV
jgi:hypothetical protein